MRALVAAAMEQGAMGLSSGLIYAPASYATTEEVIELAKVALDFAQKREAALQPGGGQQDAVVGGPAGPGDPALGDPGPRDVGLGLPGEHQPSPYVVVSDVGADATGAQASRRDVSGVLVLATGDGDEHPVRGEADALAGRVRPLEDQREGADGEQTEQRDEEVVHHRATAGHVFSVHLSAEDVTYVTPLTWVLLVGHEELT